MGKISVFIIDTMEYTKKYNIPGILVSLDFRKAFDSLEWPFIMRTLDVFNFGTSIQKWVSTFYTNIESATHIEWGGSRTLIFSIILTF